MSEPVVTEADREKVRHLRAELGWEEAAYPTPQQLVAYLRQCPGAVAEETTRHLIAASQEATWCRQANHEHELEYLRDALAAERTKAQAPFLALAERWESNAQAATDAGIGALALLAANEIRRAAEETE